ncbi:MAG TPA: OsmC family protein [Polyangia bacterium]|nr:OsmC family protein [Polyangia bacterium]
MSGSKLEEAGLRLTLNPFLVVWLSQSDEVLSMKALVESVGKVGSRVRLGEHELVFDQPRSVPGGEDRGPSPLDVMAAAVGACAHYFAAAYLHGRGLPTEGLSVEVEGEKERVPVSRIGRLVMRVRVPAGLSEKQVSGIERAIKSCPAYGTLLHSPSVDITIDSGVAEAPTQAQSA